MIVQEIENLRKDFPMLQKKMRGQPLVYFDNAATTLRPLAVTEALVRYYTEQTGTVHRALYEFAELATDAQHKTRQKLQEWIGAKSEKEIIFTSGTTASLNLLASSFGEAFIKEGDEIIISEIEHHSNFVPWQMLCNKKKAHLKIAPVLDSTELDLNALESLLNERTKLVSITHISNAFGTENPLEEIIRIIRRRSDAKIAIDGAQSVAHMKINVQKLDIDFYAFSAHKMYGPTGVGVLYGKEALLNDMPPYQGGGDMIDEVTLDYSTYNELPFKFEAGTPNIAGILGLGAAIDYLNKVGLDIIWAKEQELLAYAETRLNEIKNITLLGQAPQKGAILAFVIKGAHPLDIATLLDLRGIALRSGHLCVQPGLKRFNQTSVLRISFSFYNTFNEIDFFIQSLKEIIDSLY
ncbi:MAG: Cysteine desulfurase [Chlamydiae bacterium]|nr:Cysteine desulfurase [Chlamydiota bacterium]